MTNDEREPTKVRTHSTYKQDHWEVLDLSHVDNVFATVSAHKSDPSRGELRIDIDGYAASSTMRTLAEEDDNVNVSAWLSVPEAVQLRDSLNDALSDVKSEE